MNIFFNPNQSAVHPYQVDRSQEARQTARFQQAQNSQESDNSAQQGDRVSLSQDAALLTEARRTAQATPDVRQEKVDALKQQVSDGTYTIDSRTLASNLLAEEHSLFKI